MRKTNLPISRSARPISAALRLFMKKGLTLCLFVALGVLPSALNAQIIPDCNCNGQLNVNLDSDGLGVISPRLVLEDDDLTPGVDCPLDPAFPNAYHYVRLVNQTTGAIIAPNNDSYLVSGVLGADVIRESVLVTCENLGSYDAEVWIDHNVDNDNNVATGSQDLFRTCWGVVTVEDKLNPTIMPLPPVTLGCDLSKVSNTEYYTQSFSGAATTILDGGNVLIPITVDLPVNAIIKDLNVSFAVSTPLADQIRVRANDPVSGVLNNNALLLQSALLSCGAANINLTIDEDTHVQQVSGVSVCPLTGKIQSNNPANPKLDGVDGQFGHVENGVWSIEFIDTAPTGGNSTVTAVSLDFTYTLAPIQASKHYFVPPVATVVTPGVPPVSPTCIAGAKGIVTPTFRVNPGTIGTFGIDFTTLPAMAVITDVNVSVNAGVANRGSASISLEAMGYASALTPSGLPGPVGPQLIVNTDNACTAATIATTLDDEASAHTCGSLLTTTPGNVDGNPVVAGVQSFLSNFELNNPVTDPANTMWNVVLTAGASPVDVTSLCIKVSFFVPELAPAMGDDNCDDNLTYSYTDQNAVNACGAGNITRTWTVTDSNGNTATANQTITCVTIAPPIPYFPADITMACGVTVEDLDPEDLAASNTATRFYDEPRYYPADQPYCGNLAVTHEDIFFDECLPYGFKIGRIWSVWDWCNSTLIATCTQEIVVQDVEAPTITVPSTPIVLNSGYTCNVDVTSQVPAPVLGDNCDTAPTYTSHLLGADGTIYQGTQLLSLGKGAYTIVYEVTDKCGNKNTATRPLEILDLEPPTPVAITNTNVSISLEGQAWIHWNSIDNGSYDNCQRTNLAAAIAPAPFNLDLDADGFVDRDVYGLLYAIERMDVRNDGTADGSTFSPTEDETVFFDCNDVGNTVLVVLRVWDDCDLDGVGDNYNETMINVFVDDKINPQIVCPPNITILCTQDELDTDITGVPTVFDNCNTIEPDYVDTPSLDVCGAGFIDRTWTVVDAGGRSSSCVQRITITLNASTRPTVTFPADITLENCTTANGMLTPSDLGIARTGDITLSTSDYCGTMGTTFKDVVFDLCGTGNTNGFKIRREWIVSDWCDVGYELIQYQEIVVTDTEKPNLTVSVDNASITSNDCLGAVVISVSATDNCAGDLAVTSDDATLSTSNSGATWTGNYAAGTYTVTFEARDACNNFRTETVTFTVTDAKAPTARCKNINMQLKATGIVVLTPNLIDGGSDDNCTDAANLTFQVELVDPVTGPAGPVDQITFSCASMRSTQTVRLHVTDADGSTAFCTALVEIQNNFADDDIDNPCPPQQPVASVAGFIGMSSGAGLSDVTVMLNNDEASSFTTNDEGKFEFSNLPTSADYMVTPEKDINHTNGVTTWDIVLIRKHLLNFETFDNSSKYIAADINHDGRVSTSDIYYLRQVLLNSISTFPNNTSWRFVDAAYTFRNIDNPLSEAFPENVMNYDLQSNQTAINFNAIKVGDIDGTASESISASQGRNTNQKLSLEVNDRSLKAGDSQRIAVRANDFTNVNGMQFTLANTAELEFTAIEPAALDLSSANASFAQSDRGLTAISWDSQEPLTITDGEVLFYAIANVKSQVNLSSALSISDALLSSEAYEVVGSDATFLGVQVTFAERSADASETVAFTLYQNRPNPFNTSTVIGFELSEAGQADLTVFNVAGTSVAIKSGDFAKGYNEFTITSSELGAGNVFYYQLESGANVATKKMVLIK